MKIIYFIFVQILSSSNLVASFLLEDPDQPGVTFVKNSTAIQVTVDENNNGGRTKVIWITEVQGEIQLINPDTAPEVIQAEIEEEDSNYVVTVNLLDYEKLKRDGIETAFVIGIKEGDDQESFTLLIKNIDDESPTLKEDACLMDEEVVIDLLNTECQFNISDPDGWLAGINFKIAGELGNIFELIYEDEPNDRETWSYVYIVLKEGQKLDYETVNIYNISVEVTDAAGHPSNPPNVTLTVLVEDQLPVWVYFPFDKDIYEATNMSFTIVAIDNDSNKEVNYNISYDSSDLFTIDSKTGNLTITSINGKPDKENFDDDIWLSVRAYYPEHTFGSSYVQNMFNIIDIDDNVAKVDKTSGTITINKISETFYYSSSATDADRTDEYSVYFIELIVPDEVKSAFDVSPKNGTKYTSITIAVQTTQLDFDDPKWRSFQIELRTTGVATPENVDSFPITVNLSGAKDLVVNWTMVLFLICSIMIYS